MKEILVSMYLGYDKDGDYCYVAVSEEGLIPCISDEPRNTDDEWETPEGFETWYQWVWMRMRRLMITLMLN
jgi:hypothetical protein